MNLLILLHMNIHLCKHHLLNRLVFSPLNCFCQKSVVHICANLILNHSCSIEQFTNTALFSFLKLRSKS